MLNLGFRPVPDPQSQNRFQIRKARKILHGIDNHSCARLQREAAENQKTENINLEPKMLYYVLNINVFDSMLGKHSLKKNQNP